MNVKVLRKNILLGKQTALRETDTFQRQFHWNIYFRQEGQASVSFKCAYAKW